MKKLKSLLGGVLALALALSLVAGACAPVEVPEEIAKLEAEIADLEDDVAAEKTKTAAEKAKVSDLEKEIAALKKPVEVIEILLNAGIPGGMPLMSCELFKEELEEATAGRIQVDIVLGEAIVTTYEQLKATGEGIFDMLNTHNPYFHESVPVLGVVRMTTIILAKPSDLWVMIEMEGWRELIEQGFATQNVRYLSSEGYDANNYLISTVPIPTLADLKGVKIRASGPFAEMLTIAGASTVWIAGEEIYTGLATGLIDAADYDTPLVNYEMGFHEVTKYWIGPPFYTVLEHGWSANMDFWNNLSEADQVFIDNLSRRVLTHARLYDAYKSAEVLALVQEVHGIELQYFDEEDVKHWKGIGMQQIVETLELKDEASVLAMELLLVYGRAMGYID